MKTLLLTWAMEKRAIFGVPKRSPSFRSKTAFLLKAMGAPYFTWLRTYAFLFPRVGPIFHNFFFILMFMSWLVQKVRPENQFIPHIRGTKEVKVRSEKTHLGLCILLSLVFINHFPLFFKTHYDWLGYQMLSSVVESKTLSRSRSLLGLKTVKSCLQNVFVTLEVDFLPW